MKSIILPFSPEPLEARIAPAGILTFTDIDGDLVTVKTSKGTNSDLALAVHRTAAGSAGGFKVDFIDLTALNGSNLPIFAGSALTVTATRGTTGGDGFVDVTALTATGVTLGAVLIDGNLGAINEGVTGGKLPSLTVNSMVSAAQSAVQGNIGTVTVKHDVDGANLTVHGSVDSLQIGGSIIGFVDVQGLLKVAKVQGSLIGGTASGSGSLYANQLGDVTIGGSIIGGSGIDSGRLVSTENIGKVVVGHDLIGGTNTSAGTIASGTESNTGDVKSITIKGNVQGNAQATEMIIVRGNLPSLTIGGSVIGGTSTGDGAIDVYKDLTVATITGSVTTGPNGGRASLFVGGVLKSLTIGGDLSALAGSYAEISSETGSAGAITIKGSILAPGTSHAGIGGFDRLGKITVGGEIRGNSTDTVDINGGEKIDSLTVTGDVSWMLLRAGQIGAVKIGGSLTASNIRAGVGSGTDGVYGTVDDVPVSGNTFASKIASIVIGGTVRGTVGGTDRFRFEAAEVGSFKVGATVFKLTPGAGNDNLNLTDTKLFVGSTGDVAIQEVGVQ